MENKWKKVNDKWKVLKGFTLLELLTMRKHGQARVKTQFGFTLIELLIVISIIGVLAIIIFTLVDPAENNAKARDAGRIAAVTQLGKAVTSYNVNSDDTDFPDVTSWDTDLVATGQPASFPDGVRYGISGSYVCTTFAKPDSRPTYCYDVDLNYKNAIVFATMESSSQKTRCPAGDQTFFVYSTAEGTAGYLCGTSDPIPWEKGSVTLSN